MLVFWNLNPSPLRLHPGPIVYTQKLRAHHPTLLTGYRTTHQVAIARARAICEWGSWFPKAAPLRGVVWQWKHKEGWQDYRLLTQSKRLGCLDLVVGASGS